MQVGFIGLPHIPRHRGWVDLSTPDVALRERVEEPGGKPSTPELAATGETFDHVRLDGETHRDGRFSDSHVTGSGPVDPVVVTCVTFEEYRI